MLILASASPARRQLLENAGLQFNVLPAQVNEREIEQNLISDKSEGHQLARELAQAKAESVSKVQPDDLVIGADQTLIHNGTQLHKPADMQQAVRQLWSLRGQTHHLHAGVALALNGKTIWSHVDTAKLTMRAFSQSEMSHVIALEGEEVLGSVGAYRLENASIRLFERIEGDYFTILGLPLLALLQGLRQNGIAA